MPSIGPRRLTQYSSLSYGKLILWSGSYFAHRYSWMEAPSNTRFCLPDVLSIKAGIRPLADPNVRHHKRIETIKSGSDVRLIFKNQSSFWVFFEISMLWALYLTPNSSRVMLILWPFGVPPEYLRTSKYLSYVCYQYYAATYKSMSVFGAIAIQWVLCTYNALRGIDIFHIKESINVEVFLQYF